MMIAEVIKLVILDRKQREDIALHRFAILSPLISGTYDGSTKKDFFVMAASQSYRYINDEDVTYSWYTFARWYQAYQKEGFDGLFPKQRKDAKQHRKIDDDIADQIVYLKQEYPRLPATLIKQKLLDNGTIKEGDISLSTINRFINERFYSNENTKNKDMRRYERKHINEVWNGDSSVGPYIKLNGKKERTYIIALIDDASRMIVGIDIFLNDNFVNLMSVIRSGVSCYGKPKLFNFDNGSNYRSNQMALVSARLGSTINYCAPYTPTSKAKIERWFRTMKDQWMSQLNMNDYKSLEELRTSLREYVQRYNQTAHSSLGGKTPQERFFQESSLIIRIDEEKIDKIFLLEIERKVSADNVVRIDNQDYEVDYRYANQKLLIRYSPDLSKVYVVDRQTNELSELHLLNKQANATIKRQKIRLTQENE